MRILLRTPLSSTSGYGRDGIALAETLMAREHTVDLHPYSVKPPIPAPVANLLTYPILDGYDLELHHAPPGTIQAPSHTKAKTSVLWTMWEWDRMSPEVPGFENTEKHMNKFDTVVGYTQQSMDAFEAADLLDEDQAKKVLQGGVPHYPWKLLTEAPDSVQEQIPNRRYNRDTFRFAMVGHLASRKNAYSVVNAFTSLKEEHGDEFDAQLILKTGFPLFPPGWEFPGVTVLPETEWTDTQLREFYWSIDCLVNCSWGEGKDLPAMEATLCGVPTILNDTPGHRGWVHPGIKELLPTTTRNLDPDHSGRYTEVKDIAAAMWETYSHRAAAFNKAHELAAYVQKRGVWSYRVEKLGKEIGVPL